MHNHPIALKIHSTDIGDEYPVRIMGVLNLSPESFYGASVVQNDTLVEQARQMIRRGADILDLGARSTAPRSAVIDIGTERARIEDGIHRLLGGCDIAETLLSLDTQFREVAEVAYAAMDREGVAGNFMLNDVSCLTADPSLASWAGEVGCPVVIMAAHARPGDSLGVDQTVEDLERGLEHLAACGAEERSIVDPAIGRWVAAKTGRYDCELLRDLERFRVLGRPILVGISRKSFVGEILDRPDPADRLAGTQAATAVAVFNGAHIIRTHDVDTQSVDTIRVASAIRSFPGVAP